MDEKDQTKEQKIEELRENTHRSTDPLLWNFDAWLCLGGDYRDLAEAQESASQAEIDKLSLDYTAFQEKMEYNPMVEKADAAQSRQWFRGSRHRRDAVWEIPRQGGEEQDDVS